MVPGPSWMLVIYWHCSRYFRINCIEYLQAIMAGWGCRLQVEVGASPVIFLPRLRLNLLISYRESTTYSRRYLDVHMARRWEQKWIVGIVLF